MQSLKLQFFALICGLSVLFFSVAVEAAEKTIKLTPANTKIEFVGSHVVEKKPDPEARKGEFKKFNGTLTMKDKVLSSIKVVIDTTSISTGNAKLDAHLKSPDFFSVRQYPKATFQSTKIDATGRGPVTITGELTMLKETKTISFPATIDMSDGLELHSEFIIDRSEFGMNYGVDKVDKYVEMKITIDE